MLKKFLGLPASLQISIVIVLIAIGTLFIWMPVIASVILLITATVFAVTRIMHYFIEGN